MLTDAPQRAGEHPRRCCQRPGSGMAARLKQQHGMLRLKRQHGKLNSCRRPLVVHGMRYIIREHQNPRTDGTRRLPAHTRYKDNMACRRSAFGTSPSADDTKTAWHSPHTDDTKTKGHAHGPCLEPPVQRHNAKTKWHSQLEPPGA